MLKPIRLFGESLRQFAIGLGPAILMAFVCLAFQIVFPRVVGPIWHTLFPSEPEPEQSVDEWLESLQHIEPSDWRDRAGELIDYTIPVSTLFFFHVLVALMLTAWLLRDRAGFAPGNALRRAVRGAAMFTCAAAVVFGAAYFVDNIHPATSSIRFNFKAAAIVAVWFGGSALLLPGRLMGFEPSAAPGFLRNTLFATMALVPWFYASEVLGAPLRHCRDCGGMLDGGLIYLSVLGAYWLGLTVSSAAVSAAACMPSRQRLRPAFPDRAADAVRSALLTAVARGQ